MGIIYQIQCLETWLVYIGKTTKTLKRRFTQHKSEYITGRSRGVFEILKNGFAFSSVLEVVEDESKLSEREFYYIQNTTNRVNKYDGTFDKKEYRETNKKANKEYSKKYRQDNKKTISEKTKEKYTCGCGATLRKDCKYKHEKKSKKHQNWLANNP
jgi:hypothetical protein